MTPTSIQASGGGGVDLVSGWGSLWGTLSTALGGNLVSLVAMAGVAVAVAALVVLLLSGRKRAAGRAGKRVVGMFALSALMVAPNIVVTIALGIVQALINAVLSIIGAA